MKSTNWLDNDLAITHASGSFVIFDSSEEFAEVKSMIEFSLTAGVIRIRTLEFKPNDSIFLVLHRIMSIEP
jgi:hypothetical protein